MKKAISLMLVVVVIFSVLSLSLFATAAASSLELDTPTTITYSKFGTYLKFVPTESGYYLLEPDSKLLDTYAELYDKNISPIYENDDTEQGVAFSLLYYLEADTTYYYCIGTKEAGTSFAVTLKKVQNTQLPDADSLSALVLDKTVSCSGADYYTFTPKISGNYTLVIADNVKCSLFDYNKIEVAYNSAELTYTLEHGMTYIYAIGGKTEITLTKTEPTVELSQGVAQSTDINKNVPYVLYSFTPVEDGIYEVISIGEGADSVIRLCDSDFNEILEDDDSGDGANFYVQKFLEGGTTYYFEIRNAHLSNADTFDVVVSLADVLVGDSDRDNRITVLDATNIQLHLVKHISLDEKALFLSNVDDDSLLTVLDASKIQLFVADIIDEL